MKSFPARNATRISPFYCVIEVNYNIILSGNQECPFKIRRYDLHTAPPNGDLTTTTCPFRKNLFWLFEIGLEVIKEIDSTEGLNMFVLIQQLYLNYMRPADEQEILE